MKRAIRSLVEVLLLAHGAYASAPVDLQTLIDRAAAGDTLYLEVGRYGSARIDRPLVLVGRGPATVIDAGGSGHTLALMAPDITLRRLRLTGSGTDIDRKESGVWIDRTAPRAHLEDLVIDGCGFGVWADAVKAPRIENCRITGRDDAAMVSDLGNGIHLFNVTGGIVRGNSITKGRDGVYISNSSGCTIAENRIRHTRFAIHYMYSHANRVVGNRADSSSVGIALMYSKHLEVRGNRIAACHTHGILLRNLYYSRITGNRAVSNQDGFFFSGCSYDTLQGNYAAYNRIGIQVSDAPDNLVAGNAFIGNEQALNYQNNIELVWDSDQGGNYWDGYVGWDRDGDGIGDRRYYPMDVASYLVQRFPAVRLVLHSPAMALLQGLEERFPVLRPPGVLEPRPLMAAPVPPDAGGR